ncbi:hypothetical protein B7494_g849 [Chlorociboria aeruginascens]|nr:hypothetical protein B7494_g849 [Chlorociboria aeruginascens]
MMTTRYDHGLIEATTRYGQWCNSGITRIEQGLLNEPQVAEVASIHSSALRKSSLSFLLPLRIRSGSNTSALLSSSDDNEAIPRSSSSRRGSLLKHFPWSRSNSYASNATTIVANSGHEAISASSTASLPAAHQNEDNDGLSANATTTTAEPSASINSSRQSSQLENDFVSSVLDRFSGLNRPVDGYITHRRQARKEKEIKREKCRYVQNKIKTIDDHHKRDIKKHREKQKRTEMAAKRKAEMRKSEDGVREINARRASREGEMLATQNGLWEKGVHVTECSYRGAIRNLFTGYGVAYKGRVYLNIRTWRQ